MSSDDQTPRDRGRRLRGESTDAERKLWKHLRAKHFGGFNTALGLTLPLCVASNSA
jgi:very-short-patch-repair endonuclease